MCVFFDVSLSESIHSYNTKIRQACGPFLEGPEKFSHPKSHHKISYDFRVVLCTYFQ